MQDLHGTDYVSTEATRAWYRAAVQPFFHRFGQAQLFRLAALRLP